LTPVSLRASLSTTNRGGSSQFRHPQPPSKVPRKCSTSSSLPACFCVRRKVSGYVCQR
jgi:hypothetical protein